MTNLQTSRQGALAASRFFRRFCSLSTRQRGQALPLGIAFMMVGMVGAFVLFNTGQVAVNKQRLSDAADSAAYSGMVWQARALNFQAYTNRAMIANDVTIGQAVSLTSWSTYAAIGSANIADVTSPVPILNTITRMIATVFQTVSQVVKPVAQAMVTFVSVINGVIEGSQTAMFASAFIATPDIIDQVAKASDEHFEADSKYAIAGVAMNLYAWESFTEKYEQDDLDAMRERTTMVSDSRDPFATNRNWRFFDKFWFFISPFLQHRIYYDGQTRLLMSEDASGTPNWEWVAKDGASLHNKIYYFKRFSWKKRVEQVPIGWASAYANSDSGDTKTINSGCRNYTTTDHTKQPGDGACVFLSNNSSAEALANAGTPGYFSGIDSGPLKLTGYTGVNAFRSLSQTVLADDDGTGDPVLRLRTEISMDMDKTQTSSDWVHDSEPFATEVVSAGNKLSSISIAEVYYRHPKAYITSKRHIALQRANGYNPYWDVRLAPVELEERLAALALRDGFLGGGGGTVTPGSAQLAAYGGGDGGIDFEFGGNISDTSDSLGTLASVMDRDGAIEGALRTRVTDAIAESKLYDAADKALLEARAEIDVIETAVRDTAKDTLFRAKEELLASFFGGSLNADNPRNQAILNEAERITTDALAINERMEAVRDDVAVAFEAALLSEVGPYEVVIADLQAQIAPLVVEFNRVDDDLNGRSEGENSYPGLVAERDGYENQIEILKGQLATATRGLYDDITNTVLTTMTTTGAEFFVDGVTGDLRDFIEEGLHPMISEYLSLTEEERNEHESGGILPWDKEDEDEEWNQDIPVYGNFEK